MPCGICRQAGHNRSTCPQRNITGIPLQRVTPTPPVMAPVPRISSQTPLQIRTRWKKAIKSVLYFRRYAKIVSRWSHLGYDDPRIYYPSWMKVKDLKGHMSDEITNHWKYRIYHCMDDMIARYVGINVFQCIRNACLLLHLERSPPVLTLPDDNKRICLKNLREANYLVYWVIGNIGFIITTQRATPTSASEGASDVSVLMYSNASAMLVCFYILREVLLS